MPSNITAYRVLIELSPGLDRERQLFSDTIHAFNESEAVARGVLFVPVGWDPDTVPSHRRISEELETVDYLVLLLWDRWPENGIAEYELAMECQRNDALPMAQVVPFFKAVPPRQLADPGPQLESVQEFKTQLESDGETTFETFEQVDDLADQLRRLLSRWLVHHERRSPVKPKSGPADRSPSHEDQPDPGEHAARRWRAHPLGDTPEDFNEYGLFLQREGMLDDAESIHRRALELSGQAGHEDATAVVYGNLGVIHRRRGEFDKAEEALEKALTICKRVGWREGMAACYSGLGLVYRPRDMLDRAEEMFQQALEIEKELGRQEGVAACYGYLALICDFRGEPEKAEEVRHMAQTVREEPEYPRGSLFPRRS